MTKVTNIQNKDELLSLSTQLSDEITILQTEIDSIKTKLGTITNYDGMNFAGVASLISGNLTNVLTSLQTLSGNVSDYVIKLNEFDQYEDPVPDEDLTAPELALPDETTQPEEEEQQEETEPDKGTEPDNGENQEETPEEDTEESPTTGPTIPTTPDEGNTEDEEETSKPEPEQPTEQQPEDSKPEQPSDQETEKPSEQQPQNPSQPSNPGPTQPSNPKPSEPAFEPEQLKASEEIIIGVGNPNVDVSNYNNNLEMGYIVTTGNTSYELGKNDYELLCAIIAAESDGSYDNTLAIASAVLNRCENSEYKNLYGMDPIAQITASNQFEGYTSGEFQQYIGNTSDIVMQAVKDALAGVRNHTSCTLNN